MNVRAGHRPWEARGGGRLKVDPALERARGDAAFFTGFHSLDSPPCARRAQFQAGRPSRKGRKAYAISVTPLGRLCGPRRGRGPGLPEAAKARPWTPPARPWAPLGGSR